MKVYALMIQVYIWLHDEGVCIDDTGLYMVAETLNGIHYPVHVQKSILGKQTQILVKTLKFGRNAAVTAILNIGIMKCKVVYSTLITNSLCHWIY